MAAEKGLYEKPEAGVVFFGRINVVADENDTAAVAYGNSGTNYGDTCIGGSCQ